MLQAGIAQSLREAGLSGDDLLRRTRDALGRAIRPATLDRLVEAAAEASAWKVAFANLVSGRFTEIAFKKAYDERLDAVGILLYEDVAARSFLDFRLRGASISVQ